MKDKRPLAIDLHKLSWGTLRKYQYFFKLGLPDPYQQPTTANNADQL